MRTGRPKKPLEIATEDREKLNMIAAAEVGADHGDARPHRGWM
jgi:hypothetical protein